MVVDEAVGLGSLSMLAVAVVVGVVGWMMLRGLPMLLLTVSVALVGVSALSGSSLLPEMLSQHADGAVDILHGGLRGIETAVIDWVAEL